MIDANSKFFAILTDVGAAKLANANVLGVPWNITEMGVGDANDTDPQPSAKQTKLINEWRRRPLNQLRIDPVNSAVIIAEQVIPADEGGRWIREVGLYDKDGDLVAVANCAPSFKPILSQGSGRTQVVRMNLIVSSNANISLKIDPAVVLATREYVDSRILEELSKLDIKQSVRVATTTNINLVGLQTIDGVTLAAGDRVLVKSQSLAKNNGPWVAAVGAWVRTKDADSNVKVTPNLTIAVEEGATLADTVWQLVTDGPIVVGTTALTFKDITDGLARLLSPSFAGNPTAPTPVLFDNSKSLATTEYVMRAAGSYRGFTSLTAAASLTTAAAGTVVTTIGTFTVTLPAANVMPIGGAIHFHNIGAGVVNVECVAGDSYNVGGGDHPVSIALQPGATLTVASSPGQASWWAWGTAQLQYAKVLGYTSPKFDNSKALATTEFVQRAQGSYADSVAYQGNTTLTPADVGRLVAIGGTSAYATLPDAAAVPLGSVVTVLASTTVGLTVQARPGQSLVTLSSVAGPFLLAPSTMSVFRRLNDGTGWVLEDGDSALKYSPLFASNIGASGWFKRPDGLIEQWGSGVTDANGYVYVTFPIPFPTAMRNITPVHVGGDCLMHAVMGAGISKTGCTLRVQNSTNTSSVNWQVWWRAIGN